MLVFVVQGPAKASRGHAVVLTVISPPSSSELDPLQTEVTPHGLSVAQPHSHPPSLLRHALSLSTVWWTLFFKSYYQLCSVHVM